MKHLKIDVVKMLADVAVMPMKERGEYISEVLRQARAETEVTHDWIQSQIDLSHKRAEAGSKGGSKVREKKEKAQRKPRTPKAEKPQQKMYSQDVFLYEADYEKLVQRYSKSTADLCIKLLQDYKTYKASKGDDVHYVSDYAAINKWVLEKAIKQEQARSYVQKQNHRLEKADSPEEFAPVDF